MELRAPNVVVLVVSGLLALAGVLSALPLALPVPGLTPNAAAWYIFLGWFLLAAASALPHRSQSQP